MKKLNHWCFSIPRGVKRKRRFNIGAYQHAKKIAVQNAQAEQSRAVESLRIVLLRRKVSWKISRNYWMLAQRNREKEEKGKRFSIA